MDGLAVRCDGLIHIKPAASLNEIRKTDLIFIPSTGLSVDGVVERNAPVVPWLHRWHKRGVAIAACAQVWVWSQPLACSMANRATTHWSRADRFREKYPKVRWMPDLMVPEDHNFCCGGGGNAALDLSLYLVERFCGHDVAMQSAKALLIETHRAWQSGFALVHLKTEHSDESTSSAQDGLHQNFTMSSPLETPARSAGMSLRNFIRRFKQATGDSPLIHLQKLRSGAAKRLREGDHRSVQEISNAVGYQDVTFFREIFQRHTRVSPSAYRQRFGM